MADREPLVVAAGALRELPAGDFLSLANPVTAQHPATKAYVDVSAPRPVLDDPFTVNSLANYVADQGTSMTGLSVSGGVLVVSDANDHTFHHVSLTATDSKQIVKVNPDTNALVAIVVKFVDNNNWIAFQHIHANSTFVIVRMVGGTLVNSLAIPSVPIGTFWMKAQMTGNIVAMSTFAVDPMIGGAEPFSIASFTLTGSEVTALGAAVSGAPGLRLAGYNLSALVTTTTTLDDWVVVTSVPRSAF